MQAVAESFVVVELSSSDVFLLWEALNELACYHNKMSMDLVDRGNLTMAGRYTALADKARAKADHYLVLYRKLKGLE